MAKRTGRDHQLKTSLLSPSTATPNQSLDKVSVLDQGRHMGVSLYFVDRERTTTG